MFNISACSLKLNNMDGRTHDSDIARRLAEVAAAISIDLRILDWTSPQTALVEVGRKSSSTMYQMAWLPHATLSELARIDHHPGSHRLLVASSQISSRTADALRDAHIDFIDYAGNAHLDFGQILIDIRGRRSALTRQDRRHTEANLFSARRMQVLFGILSWPGLLDGPVRSIAQTAGTSVGITQSTLEIMKESDYLVGRSLHRRDELLDLWSAAYRGTLLPKIRDHAYAGDIRDWTPPPGHLVSGESAVDTIRHPQTLTVYTRDFDPMVAIRNGWHRSDDPNIEIRQKFWTEPAGATDPQPFGAFTDSAAPPVLVYADLLASKEPRQAEVAEALRRDDLV